MIPEDTNERGGGGEVRRGWEKRQKGVHGWTTGARPAEGPLRAVEDARAGAFIH